jgi:hypothetical protein
VRGCRRYLKVVDTRKMVRSFYPPLEQVASLHLDMLAAEKGYSHAVASTTLGVVVRLAPMVIFSKSTNSFKPIAHKTYKV